MQTPRLEEVRLTSFKSFTGQRLPLQDLTVLIGRNGSGKSNALDALMVLSRLASGEPLREALDGTRSGADQIRGGAVGCAPLEETEFAVGCRVRSGEAVYDLDVRVGVHPELRIVSERLTAVEGVRYAGRRLARGVVLLDFEPSDEGTAGQVEARHFNGRRGVEPAVPFAADRLLLGQVPVRIPLTSEATRLVHQAAGEVLGVLRDVFLLDPVPHLMRQYVNAQDSELRRNADNLSAAVAGLEHADPDAFARLTELVAGMPEYPVRAVDKVGTALGDVQLVLREAGFHGREHDVPARLLSDGMLRFLAFGTALLSTAPEDGGDGMAARRHLVIEEIENGLYPTQAARVLRLMREESRRRRVDVLFTTHSPALLNALTAQDHGGVVVCTRDGDTGESRLTPLTELPGYVDLLAAGDLGDAVSKGRLPQAVRPRDAGPVSVEDFLREL
ncbi:ATP-binding protein [Streptomyces sp. NPDC003077]|uniref:AAA family ATPase n=1 Tax=Streptomyces sp. NPDC003077 TaxID=3154443 RepID=UPI0033B82A6D